MSDFLNHQAFSTPFSSESTHVWWCVLDRFDPANFRSLLSSDELAKADRYVSAHHRNRYTVCRGLLRILLSSYITRFQLNPRQLDCSPSSLAFDYGDYKKPSLKHFHLQFNISHSDVFAVIAITPTYALGVDIEVKAPKSDFHQLAQRFFAPQEALAVTEASEEEIADVFYSIWTRKEAFIKCMGSGLFQDLQSFSIQPNPLFKHPQFMHLNSEHYFPTDFSCTSFQLPLSSAHACALVLQNNVPSETSMFEIPLSMV